MYNIILRNFYKQAEPSLQVVIALAKVGSTFLDREKTLHIYFLKSQSSLFAELRFQFQGIANVKCVNMQNFKK